MSATSPLTRPVEEHRFASHDGLELFYRHWPAQSENPRGAILMFHRGHEHSARMAHLVAELNMPDFAFFAWDARDHGLSKNEKFTGTRVFDTTRDVQAFVDHISAQYGFAVQDMAVIGQSVGAVQVAGWLHDYAPPVRAVTLAAPAFSIKLYVPLARTGLGLMRKLRGNFSVTSYVRPGQLTHDTSRQKSYKTDPLITPSISVDMLLDVYNLSDRIVQDARAIIAPVQVLVAGSDFVVRHAPQHRFYERLASPFKERRTFRGLRHDLLGEEKRAPVVAEVRRFILERFEAEPAQPSLLDADKHGFTRDEFDRLSSPLPMLSPCGVYWSALRTNLKIGAMLSEGLKLGQKTGFDSGSTLDYVYENTPRGRWKIGGLIDQNYLNAIGWRGIRQRKIHVEEMLSEAMQRLKAADMPVRIMDVAAGHGRYVLDAVANSPIQPERVMLRDFSDLNVTAGRKLIAERKLENIATFEHGDAFDGDNIAAIEPKPTVTVVSGLYELFPDNSMIRKSLAGIGAAVPPGGYLVYTGQPWHPQLEMIARGLTSHRNGQDWIMRRRTQAEMDQLVADAGFEKVDQRIDEWGIFTVSLARRRGGAVTVRITTKRPVRSKAGKTA